MVGGPTTHAAILARALEIPAVSGLDPQVLSLLRDGQQIAIDGTHGLLYLATLHEQTMKYWQGLARQLLKGETAEEMQAVLQRISER